MPMESFYTEFPGYRSRRGPLQSSMDTEVEEFLYELGIQKRIVPIQTLEYKNHWVPWRVLEKQK